MTGEQSGLEHHRSSVPELPGVGEGLASQERRSIPERPDWDEYFLGIAKAVSSRSDCERDKVGAVVVGSDRRIRATGYNGSPAGMAGCSDCPRRTSDVAPGSCYSNCVAVHAELNALLFCDRQDLPGSTLYVTREPCYGCSKAIQAAGVKEVVWKARNQTTVS